MTTNGEQFAKRSSYKYRIDGSQSVATGIIGIGFSLNYDDNEGFRSQFDKLVADLEYAEQQLKKAGYKTAKNIEPKPPKEKTETKELKISKSTQNKKVSERNRKK